MIYASNISIPNGTPPPRYLKSIYDFLENKYKNTVFDAILASDNNALTFLLAHRKKLFPDVPVVFCGINSFTPDLIKGEDGITGVIEDVDSRKIIELMLAVHPNAERILVINDETVTGKLLNSILLQLQADYPHITWEFERGRNFHDLQERLHSLNEHDLVFLSLYLRDGDGTYYESDEVAERVSTHSPVPVYIGFDFHLGNGVVGGYTTSGKHQGQKAVELVQKILAGTPVKDIPVVMKSPNHYFADYEVVEKFNLSPDAFPEQTTFINRQMSFYEQYTREIWTFFIVMTLLSLFSIGLFITVIRKNKAENQLRALTMELEQRVKMRTKELVLANTSIRESEEKMQHLLSNLSGMVYRCKNDESWTMLFVSEGAAALTGCDPDELLENRRIAFADLIDERDREMVNQTIQEAVAEKKHFAVEYRIHTKKGELKWVWEQGLAVFDQDGQVRWLDGIINDISMRKKSEEEQKKLATAVRQTDDLILITDSHSNIEYVNPAFEKVTGYSIDEIQGCNPRFLNSGKQPGEFYTQMWETLAEKGVWRGKIINKRKDGDEFIAELSITPIRDTRKEITHYVGVLRDITHEKILEDNLRQAQKLEAMGTLAGGIAHEINTPAQYVGSNLDFLLESFPSLSGFIQQIVHHVPNIEKNPEVESVFADLYEENDIEYLLEEMPLALQQSREGIQQISHIVRSMKQFAHPGGKEKEKTDLNDALRNTATVCRNEWRYVAEMEFDLDPDLPLIPCRRSEMNQVFLNIIVNAAHAIEETGKGEGDKGVIRVQTTSEQGRVVVSISDNAGGIPDQIRSRIFDPFFTTKEPGRGSGQGLAIAYTIVTEKHGGKLSFETKSGKGTTFFIKLPLSE